MATTKQLIDEFMAVMDVDSDRMDFQTKLSWALRVRKLTRLLDERGVLIRGADGKIKSVRRGD